MIQGATTESFLGDIRERSDIGFKNINLALVNKKKERKQILNNVSGAIRHSRFTALMGPSGSGKTSLLNALAGRTKLSKGLTLTGQVLMNGKPVTNWSEFRRKCAYVEQDDLLFSTLTVRETIELAAELRLGRSMTEAERQHRIELVISELGLKKCEDTCIGDEKVRGISGGERKRVSIAVEILRGPSVIFLDECTTGLDAFQALRVATTIKDLAQSGRTIVSSIHQPRSSIFALFDDLVVLSEGNLVYSGPASKMMDYFERLGHAMPENYNPADFILDLVSVDLRSEELEQQTRARLKDITDSFEPVSDDTEDEAGQVNNLASKSTDGVVKVTKQYKYQTSTAHQFALLLQRATRQKFRNRTPLFIALFSSIFFAVLVGFVYFRTGKNLTQQAIQDKVGVIFFLCLSQFMQGMFSMLNVFPQEKFIINRERASKAYALSPYFFSRAIADLPSIVFPWLCCTILYFIAWLKQSAAAYFETAVLVVLGYVLASSIGLFVSAFAPSLMVAQTMAMPFMLIFILFSGFYANTNLIPDALSWIQWISPIRWLFAGAINVQFSGVTFECNTGPDNCVPTGEAYMIRIGVNGDSFWRSALVLLGMIVFLHLAAYLVLRVKRIKWLTPSDNVEKID